MEIFTDSPGATKDFGKKVAVNLTTSYQAGNMATTIALIGDLGSGKTTFTQGFAEGLEFNDRIISPTFILMREYSLSQNKKYQRFYHLDLYRFEGEVVSQFKELGIEEIWSDPQNIVLIEWAEKAESMLPKETIKIEFEVVSDTKRKIVIPNNLI